MVARVGTVGNCGLRTGVGVHHEQVSGQSDLLGFAQLGEDGSHRRPVQKVGKRVIRGPNRPLNVIVDA